MLNELGDWIKIGVLWLAAGIGWFFQSFTLGRLVIIATLILTVLRIYREWATIKWEKKHGYYHRLRGRMGPRRTGGGRGQDQSGQE